jgi:hypothetical protein
MAKKQTAEKPTKPNSRLVTSKGEVVANTTTAVEETPKGESRGHHLATTVYGLTQDQLDAAVEAGHILHIGETAVVIRGKGNAKDEFLTYDKFVALDQQGELIFCHGKGNVATDKPAEGDDTRSAEEKAKGTADHFNYGFDLEVKRELRSLLAELIEGPAKAIAKAAQTLLDQGVADSEEEAIAMVKAGRAKKGLPV